MADNKINVTVSANTRKNITVSSTQQSTEITASTDTGRFWSQVSKNWAVSDVIVENTDYSSKYYAGIAKESASNAEEFESAIRDVYNGFLGETTEAIENVQGARDEAIANIETSRVEAVDSINSTKTTILSDIEFVADGEKKEIQDIIDNGKDELKESIGDVKVLTTLEIGDIGFTQMAIDETKGKRRVLKGQLIIQDQYVQFTNIIKESVALNPDLACTETEWQTAVTMSTNGVCEKFVIDDEAGTIRLPKYPQYLDLTNNTSGTSYATVGVVKNASTSGLTGSVTIPAVEGVTSEKIKGTYFIQVATGAETEDNIINEIELNNPYSFGDSKYSPVALNNLSWLKSAGQWNSKAVYPAYYNWVLENANKGKANFIGLNMYGWGSSDMYYLTSTLNVEVGSVAYGGSTKRAVAVITEVNKEAGTITIYNPSQNKYEENLPRYTVQDQSSSEFISDYDWVINTAEETFRLPLLDGSEDLPSDRYDTLELKASDSNYISPANGWFQLFGKCSQNGYASLTIKSSMLQAHDDSKVAGSAIALKLPVSNGDLVSLHYGQITLTQFRFVYAQGNGSLYFYVGETVQNANLINAGRIEEKLADKVDTNASNFTTGGKSLISGYGMPSNKYIDLTLGASGTTYTAPANGWFDIYGIKTTAGYTFLMNTNNGFKMETRATINNTGCGCYIPARKGDVIMCNYDGAYRSSDLVWRFYYAEGEV